MKLLIALLFFVSFGVFAQNKPEACQNLPSGYIEGGQFDITGEGLCDSGIMTQQELVFTPAATNTVQLDGIRFIVGFTEQDDFTQLKPTQLAKNGDGNYTTNVAKEAGTYWVMVMGDKDNQNYASCSSFEIKKVNIPEVNIDLCSPGVVKVSIENSPENNFDAYFWEINNNIDRFFPSGSSTLPYEKTYSASTGEEILVSFSAFFQDNNTLERTCQTEPIIKRSNVAETPLAITELIGTDQPNQWQISFADYEEDQQYLLEYQNNGDWKTFTAIENGTAELNNVYETTTNCFRIPSRNTCTNSPSSNLACTVYLDNKLVSTSETELNWETLDPLVTKVTLLKTVVGGKEEEISIADISNLKYIDSNIDCQNEYSYQLRTETSDGLVVVSPPLLVNPNDKSDIPIPNSIVSVGYNEEIDTQMEVVVLEPESGVEVYNFYRANEIDGDFNLVNTTVDPLLIDSSISSYEEAYYYQYKFSNSCGANSITSTAFGSVALKKTGDTQIEWTPLETPEEIVYTSELATYILFKYNFSNNTYEAVSLPITDLHFDLAAYLNDTDEILKFRIKATQKVETLNGESLVVSNSNPIEYFNKTGVFIPNAFSPNKDGRNDSFSVSSKKSLEGQLIIYDRWGAVIFQTRDLESGWNGDLKNGSQAPIGIYIYSVVINNSDSPQIKKKGKINLLR